MVGRANSPATVSSKGGIGSAIPGPVRSGPAQHGSLISTCWAPMTPVATQAMNIITEPRCSRNTGPDLTMTLVAVQSTQISMTPARAKPLVVSLFQRRMP